VSPEEETRPPTRRAGSWPRRLLIAAVILLLVLPLVALAGVFLALQTQPGRDALVAAVERAAADYADLDLSIAALEGPLPQRLELRQVQVADAQGRLLTFDRLVLRWRPLALLQRRIEITSLEAERVELDRLPEGGGDAPPSEGPLRIALPELPVSLALHRLAVQELVLGEALAGVPARLGIEGRSRIERDGALDAELLVERRDGQAGRLEAVLALAAGGERLTARLEGFEPAGGLAARMLDLPGHPAVRVALDGDGPPEGWEAELRLQAEDTAELTAALRLESLEPLALTVEGRAEAAALLPPDLRSLGEPGLDFGLRLRRLPDETIEIEALHLTGPAGRLEGAATLLPGGESFTAEAALAIEESAPLLPLVEPLAFSGGRIDLRAEGRLSEPRLWAEARITDLLLPEAALAEAQLRLEARALAPLDGPEAELAFTLALSGEALVTGDPGLTPVIDGDPRLEAEGRLRLAERQLALERLEGELGSLAFNASGEGAFRDEGATASIDLGLRDPALQRFAGPAGLELQGGLALEARLDLAADGSLSARLDGIADGLQLGIPAADALLGERPSLAAVLARGADGRLRVEDLRLEGAAALLTADAGFAPDFATLEARYRLELSALEPLGDALGQPLAGALDLTGTAEGPLGGPHIRADLQGHSLVLPGGAAREVTASLDLELGPPGPRGRLEVSGSGDQGPLGGEAVFALLEQQLSLDPLRLQLGEGASLTATLELPLDGSPGRGELRGEVPRLELLSALAGTELGGALRLQAQLAPEGPRQSLDGSAVLTRPRLGPGDAPSLSGEEVELRFALRDLLGAPRLQAELQAEALEAGGASLTRLALEASGALEALQLALEAEGEAGEEALGLQADARLALTGATTRVTLERLEGTWGRETARLLNPATLTLAPDDLRLQDLEMEVFGGRLAGSARQQGNGVDAGLRLSDLPLARLAALAGDTPVEGLLSGELTLSGRADAPSGSLWLFADDFAFASEAELTRRPPLDVRAEASLEPGLLRLDSRIDGFAEMPLTLNAQLPVRLSLQPFALALIADRPLNAQLRWSGDLAPVMALAPTDAIRLTGRADMDLRAYGSLNSPQLGGQLALTEARYENFTTGTLLQPFELLLTGAGNRLTLERLEARDGGDGRIDGSGTLTWLGEEGIYADLTIALADMRLAQRDDVTARLSGEIDLIGNLVERADLTGRLTNDFLEIRLVDALPPSVAEVEVIELRDGSEPPPRREEPEPPATSPLFLDVAIELPRRVFVRGRGLESEWAGSLQVTGNAGNPQISGRLRPLRGSFTVVGKNFVLEEGSITLPAGARDLDPELDLRAVYSGSGFQAHVGVGGTASDPQIALSSTPELPEDEVLSRILFDKTSANLTPLEAVELADAAASLATGGPGVTGLMRRALGVDVLSFQPGTTEDDPGSLQIGTYLRDGIFVGVHQGVRAGSTGVTVEIDITDQIKAHSDVDADGRSRAGVRWQMDY